MAFPELPERHLSAGREYLDQLQGLGLRPEGLLWMHDVRGKSLVLWLLWSGVDRFGPFALTKLLFQAYRASALTQEIDPFLVHAVSTNEPLTKQLLQTFASSALNKQAFLRLVLNKGTEREEVIYQWKREWVYDLRKKPLPHSRVSRDWERFSANVTALAA